MPSSFTASLQLRLDLRAFRDRQHVVPSGRVAAILARCMHRSEVPPMPTPTMVGGQTRPPHSITLSMTKRLTALTPSAGISICRNEPFSEPEPFGIISISTVSSRSSKSTLMIGTPTPHEVCSFLRVIGCTTEERSGCSLRRALAAAADRFLHRRAVEFDIAADGDVVDRDAGVLAQQVLGALGDRDVLHHGAEDGRAGGVGFVAHAAARSPA